MNNLFNNRNEKSEHPPREMLLLFVDGELQTKEAAQLEAHLEACWPCRVKTQNIQDAIADIIEFDDQVLTPRLMPPQNWRTFDRKLSQLVATSGKQSFSSRFFGSLGRFLPSSHLVESTRSFARLAFVRAAVALVLTAIIVTLVILLKREPTVSASQLLNNAIEAQAQLTRSKADPVVHQKLRIARKDQAREQAIDWEIWNDTKNSRVRQFLVNGNQPILVATDSSTTKVQKARPADDLLTEFAQALKANHMDASRPLSAFSYQSWHNTLQRQRDEITKIRLADGNDVLRLHTVAASPVNIGQISEATFIVRSNDWLPVELHLSVATENGDRVYELTQTISEVVSLTQVNPSIFASQPAITPSPKGSPKQLAKNEAQPTPALAADPQPLNPIPVATADLEVEALRLLNSAGADLGEQISVKRQTDGLLHVTGIVETEKRKAEILAALLSISGNPSVRIEIQTVAEAVAQQQKQRSRSRATPAPITEQNIDIEKETIAAAPELRRHFNTDEQLRDFSAHIVNQSASAMSHVYAIKRLLAQFSPEELRSLTPEAKNKWLSLIRSHALAYHAQAQKIRSELRPIFFVNALEGAAESGPEIMDDATLVRAANRLFEVAAANDSIIRSAFAVSSASASSGVNSPQFWQSMKNVESLAARISRTQ